ncbi:hypothetical protein VTN77DRAFT_4596 [Rasamsonia byssochlamydoides]|uniref:uncharacterized protein n=1 Tax=Rasamsonia byssochlamydoides TaxID=89139 RepID=UPI00374204B2
MAAQNLGPGITAASITLTVIAVLVFALRVYLQILVSKVIQADDIFLFFGLAAYVAVVTWATVLICIKMSLLMLYQQIFMVKLITPSIAILFMYIFICTPISFWWEQMNAIGGKLVPQGSCPNLGVCRTVCTVLDIVSDGLILSLAFFGLWTLQVEHKRKAMVLGILALGSTCFIISFVQLPILVAATLDSNPALEGMLSLFFCILEASIGVISACLPGLAPLVKCWY